MRSAQIRSTFLHFFAERGHRQVPSSTLTPSDPSLLLTNAGMNQFVPAFTGAAPPPHRRVTSIQRCVRTVDIDNVGRTARHGTCFEMLGNFSFGDYFVPEAVDWAYTLLTDGFGLDPRRLWVTVHHDDRDALAAWRAAGVPDERIQRLGMADNYWSMDMPGPCGPCSEVFYDRGPEHGPAGGPAADHARYLELWNLVFMRYVRGRGPDDDFPIVGDLPARNVDTGLGLERLALVLQGVDHVCETDVLAPTLATIADLAGRPDLAGRRGRTTATRPDDRDVTRSLRVVTDHARAAAFLVADGVRPATGGRGYVLRRLLRRAVRHAMLLGIDDGALPAATASVVATLGDAWPQLAVHRDRIAQVVTAEERTFRRTLRRGARRLDRAVTAARDAGGPLSGDVAFALHDTHGVPIDLTVEAAHDAGVTVDRDRFDVLMEQQRRRARAARRTG